MKENMHGLVPWYQSVTMGNVVRTRGEALRQMVESMVKLGTPDFKWTVVWLPADF